MTWACPALVYLTERFGLLLERNLHQIDYRERPAAQSSALQVLGTRSQIASNHATSATWKVAPIYGVLLVKVDRASGDIDRAMAHSRDVVQNDLPQIASPRESHASRFQFIATCHQTQKGHPWRCLHFQHDHSLRSKNDVHNIR
jgi:hypothetical protein